METILVLARVSGIVCLLVGLSVMNKAYISAMIDELEHSKTLFWFIGFITMILGLVVLSLYNVWSFDWPVFLTIVGWAMLLKGTAIMLFPNTWVPMYKKFKLNGIVMTSGVISIVVGLILLYEGFVA